MLDGAGQLYPEIRRIKKELEEMGMFDIMYKQPIPKYATKIGICTASTGAAIQDIRNISSRRNHMFNYIYIRQSYKARMQLQALYKDLGI